MGADEAPLSIERTPPPAVYFDDLEILRTIERCERDGHAAALSSGEWLLKELLGSPQPVYDDDSCRSFIRELESAQRRDLLDFTVMGWSGIEPNIDQMGANNYLAQMRDFRLSPFGRDRARCRVFEREPPDPHEDDGKPITRLTFERIATILEDSYDERHLGVFLIDGGIPQEMIPALGNDGRGLVAFFERFNGGESNERRVIRSFLGRWLDQELDSGPNLEQERALREDLARQGWFTRNGRLVRGEPIRRATMAPLLGGDLLTNLHPRIQEGTRPLFSAGNYAAAVFEGFKAIELRVRELSTSQRSGVALMGDAFDRDPPELALNDLATQAHSDEQKGFALMFKGAMLGIRDPKAHAPFETLEERRTLDYLGFASLLMRRLDDVEARLDGTG
jgi:uncharacterized protein (TIGR02391 family)